MELVTYLNPGAFNGVKFVILYIIVDNLLVWARGKLKRAVNVSDLIGGEAIHVTSVTGNDGRNTVSAILQNFKDMRAHWSPRDTGRSIEDGATWSWMKKSWCRTLSVTVIRLTPLFILVLVFVLDFGTGSVSRCQHKKVQFEITGLFNKVTGSLKCTRFSEVQKNNNRTEYSFQFEYLESAHVGNSTFCGCDSSSAASCVSSFKGFPKMGPKIAVWNTGAARFNPSSTSENDKRARYEMLRKVRREFDFSGKIPWKTYDKMPLKKVFLISCFSYSDERRSSIACVRENTTITKAIVWNDVLLMVKAKSAISFIELNTVNRNQSAVYNLADILDGQIIEWDGLSVYRTNSVDMLHLEIDSMFVLLLSLLLRYNMGTWGLGLDDAAGLAQIITAFGGLMEAGEGTVRSCSGTILTLNSVGIVAAVLLIFLPFLILVMTLITTPESLSSLLSRGNALESWQWTVDALLSEKAGSGIPWSPAHGEALVILERTPNLQLKISSAEQQGTSCSAVEIRSIL